MLALSVLFLAILRSHRVGRFSKVNLPPIGLRACFPENERVVFRVGPLVGMIGDKMAERFGICTAEDVVDTVILILLPPWSSGTL